MVERPHYAFIKQDKWIVRSLREDEMKQEMKNTHKRLKKQNNKTKQWMLHYLVLILLRGHSQHQEVTTAHLRLGYLP